VKTVIFYISCFIMAGSAVVQAQQVWQPFSQDSPWNTRIPSNAPTDRGSRELIDSLAEGGLYINIKDWSIPVYYVDSDSVPKINVINSRPGIFGRGFAEPNQIPLLPWFIASPPVGENSDNHMCILDTAKMIEWGMWATRKDSLGNWTTGLGAVTDLKGTGVEEPWYEQERELDAHRARAGGFPLIAGLIRSEEIEAGKIDHALVFAYQRGRSEFFIPPASTAQATFMEMNNRSGIPMGGRIQLDPDIDVDTLNLSPACKIIARALQQYGAYNGDYAGATVLYADNSPAALKKWKGVLAKEDLLSIFTPAFIRAHFRVLRMGTLLPGQNLKNARYGFLTFTIQGASSTDTDWEKRTVAVNVADTSRLKSVAPTFSTVERVAKVTVGGVIQRSGKSRIDLRRRVVYKVILPGHGSVTWTVSAREK
jgi:hypothetical protein